MLIKNVVIVNDFNYTEGGASKVAINTAKILYESGLNVYFFSAVNSNNEKIIGIHYITSNQSVALKEKNKLIGIINGVYNFRAENELGKLLDTLDRNNTIVHVHGWTKALSSSIFKIAFKKKFKIVLTMHDYFTACPNGGYFNYKKNEICHLKPLSFKCIKCNCDSRNYAFKLYRIIRQFVQNKIVRLNDKLTDVISISEFSEKILKNTLNKNTKIYRVYNPIDLDKNPTKVDYRKNNYYLYVGRISKEKGVNFFCEAISSLNLKGIVVGDGEEKEKLMKLYPNITFTGWQDSKKVKEYMRGAKALIFPSLWYEGAPLTPLEAMQYGIPVISSGCNAAKDYIIEGKNGFIYYNYEDLIRKLQVIDKNNLQFKNALKMERYSSKNYKEELIKLYDKIIKEG